MNLRARISRIHTSWVVRVPGHRPMFFADGKHGGTDASLAAATAWRDEHWDGVSRVGRLTLAERAAVSASDEPASVVAERYGITRQHVWNLRSQSRRG